MAAETRFKRVTLAKAREACGKLRLEPAQSRLLDDDPTCSEFFERLKRERQMAPAIRFLAMALPKREAVWWGCLCLWHAVDASLEALPRPQRQALRAAVEWLVDPSESTRRQAETKGNAAQPATAAGALAMAAFYSDGSLTPPHLPRVPPAPHLTGKAVAAAILLAATLHGGKKEPLLQRQFLTIGEAIADGRHSWLDVE
jgi:hypothetical protein